MNDNPTIHVSEIKPKGISSWIGLCCPCEIMMVADSEKCLQALIHGHLEEHTKDLK